jgi:enamine deaminase RidA (YjgF/YER057c/UK114 family)
MPSPSYSTYPGFGTVLSNLNHYSQAVRLPTIPPTLKCSGQGGWNATTEDFAKAFASSNTDDSLRQQVSQAFSNVDLTLKSAGGRGWGEVYLVRAYMVARDSEELEIIIKAATDELRKWCPEHRPVLTGLEVKGLAFPEMKIEIEVEAMLKSESVVA